jgi:crossover junction endodeoxyribonuclease RusA
MAGVIIELPFPPAALSGHNTGHWRKKNGVVAKHREWAERATRAAWGDFAYDLDGDIRVSATFYPPDKRGDRVNYPNRMKPYWDGIADALKVNDRRFLPSFHFAEPVKDARVVVVIGS